MKTLTITSDDEEALGQVKELAESLNIPVEETDEDTMEKNQPDGARVAELFEQLAKSGNVAKLIPDPVAWQREQRKDRKLPFRD